MSNGFHEPFVAERMLLHCDFALPARDDGLPEAHPMPSRTKLLWFSFLCLITGQGLCQYRGDATLRLGCIA